MDDLPLVSIGMPAYNGERFISQALDSLLGQDHENFELIISDNASTDRTTEICRDYAARDRRIQFHQNPDNAGAVSNFNRVLHAARADYFMWAAADDLWEPTYISTLLARLMSDHRAVLAFSAFNNVDDQGEGIREYPWLFELPSDQVSQRLLNYIVQDERSGKANLIYGLIRRHTLQSAGGFKIWGRSPWGADMLVVFRLLAAGNLTVADRLLFHKRLVSTSPETPARRAKRAVPIRLVGRLRRLRSALVDRRGYIAGYDSIIRAIDQLTINDKRRLQAALRERAWELYRSEIRERLIEPALRWPRRTC